MASTKNRRLAIYCFLMAGFLFLPSKLAALCLLFGIFHDSWSRFTDQIQESEKHNYSRDQILTDMRNRIPNFLHSAYGIKQQPAVPTENRENV